MPSRQQKENDIHGDEHNMLVQFLIFILTILYLEVPHRYEVPLRDNY